MRRNLPIILIAAVFVAAIIGGVILFQYRKEAPSTPPPAAPMVSSTPVATAPPAIAPSAGPMLSPAQISPSTVTSTPAVLNSYGRAGADPIHIRGDPSAPVIVEEFGDFECLPCSIISPVLEKLEQDYGKRLAVVFREHPLRMHRYALDAARAAEAAGLQGHFWEMHASLYRNRDTWVPATYIRPYFNDYATELRLDVDRFKADMDGEQVSKRIEADQDRGESLAIDRTPVLFVNGQKMAVTQRNEKGLREAIDKALAATGALPQ